MLVLDTDKILNQLLYNEQDPLLFNSGFFLFFILVFFLFYQLLYQRKYARIIYFTVFSFYFFYKACGWYFLLIVASAVVDFNLSKWIYLTRNKQKRKLLLIISIIVNLGLLCYFKYTDFFIEIINDLQKSQLQPLKLILPIGISFYTFENLSYTIDVYRRQFKPVAGFWDYCFFLSFFPKLVMGPIVRAADFIPQIRKDIVVTREDIGKGLYLILGGLFKKVMISDYIYVNYVQYIFDVPATHSGLECLIGVYGYAMVIYCDFSGYSDMAIGMAKWMGFTINTNFDSPYTSASITEFWRRWHISLSSWLKDYLYISLGGNRKGKYRQYINLMTTMLLGGLWHGASLKFVFWGGMHGLSLAVDKWRLELKQKWMKQQQQSPIAQTLFKVAGIFFTFHLVCFCWIFFKANTFADAVVIIRQIAFNFNIQTLVPLANGYTRVLVVMLIGYIIHFLPKSTEVKAEQFLIRTNTFVRIIILAFFIWLAMQVKQAEQVMPIYLQF